ncbi:MAG TPA: alpha/beta hydrolase [Thermodesulfobacteriota bacterium]|nr:alpha/beta hydrolase [Thermodesulfobacteriota bacterium]
MKKRVALALLLFLSLTLPFSLSRAEDRKEARDPLTRLSILSSRIVVADAGINFVQAGKGPPVLFLHGLGGSWKDWAPTLPPFASKHQVVAPDFPGFGDSEAPDVNYSIEWLTEVVEKFIEAKSLRGAVVVGHSMGGIVALNLVARRNARVARLAVVDPVATGDKAEFMSHVMTRKFFAPDTEWESLESAVRERFRSMVENFVKNRKPGTAREFFESVPKNPFNGKPLLPMTPAVQLTASLIDFDIRPKLASVDCPTLILWGEKDPIAPSADAYLLAKGIRNSRVVVFGDTGHSPMIEKPDKFNHELGRFIQRAR